jgi:transposase
MFEKRFRPGYKFMQVTYNGGESVYSIHWQDVILLLESPVIKKLIIK